MAPPHAIANMAARKFNLLPSLTFGHPAQPEHRHQHALAPILKLPTELDMMIFPRLSTIDKACFASTSRDAYNLMHSLFGEEGLKYQNHPKDVLIFLNRLDNGDPRTWLCVSCIRWHAIPPEASEDTSTSLLQNRKRYASRNAVFVNHKKDLLVDDATHWHRFNPRPLCEKDPVLEWVMNWPELKPQRFGDSSYIYPMLPVGRHLYMSWTLVRAIVRSHHFGNDTKLGPAPTSVKKVTKHADAYTGRGTVAINKWSAAVADGALIIQIRTVWPLLNVVIESMNCDGKTLGRQVTSEPFPLEPFMTCSHRGISQILPDLVDCAVSHICQNIAMGSNGEEHSNWRHGCGFCKRVLLCTYCGSEFAVAATSRTYERKDSEVNSSWSRFDHQAKYGFVVTRHSFLGDGILPFPKQQARNAYGMLVAPPEFNLRGRRIGDGVYELADETVSLMDQYNKQATSPSVEE